MKKELVVVVIVCTLISSCHVGRFFVRNFANITDHKIFPYTEVSTSEGAFKYPVSAFSRGLDDVKITVKGKAYDLTGFLDEQTSTVSFLAIHQDSIVYEQYFDGYEASDLSTVFSVTKSVTSLLCGIAVDEGYIKSIDDPVTTYLPEFSGEHPYWDLLTVRHCLNMRSGLDYKEAYQNPFADMAKLYYGTNSEKQIRKLDFKEKPGTSLAYQSGTTAVIGMIIERATGRPLGEYLEEKVWKPMGMEYPATFSLDDEKHRVSKSYSGLATTARDMAKIGSLYLKGGVWNGQQIVSTDWVKASTTPIAGNENYHFQWYSLRKLLKDADGGLALFPDTLAARQAGEEKGLKHIVVFSPEKKDGQYAVQYLGEAFYAQGILNQLIYVDPEQELIIVRQGKKWDKGYLWFFDLLSQKVEKTMRTQGAF